MEVATPTKDRLEETTSVVLDYAGRAVTVAGPQVEGERWTIHRLNASGDAPAFLGVYYVAASGYGFPIAGTETANNDTSDDVIVLRYGELLSLHWFRGTPGAEMRCAMLGSRSFAQQ